MVNAKNKNKAVDDGFFWDILIMWFNKFCNYNKLSDFSGGKVNNQSK